MWKKLHNEHDTVEILFNILKFRSVIHTAESPTHEILLRKHVVWLHDMHDTGESEWLFLGFLVVLSGKYYSHIQNKNFKG